MRKWQGILLLIAGIVTASAIVFFFWMKSFDAKFEGKWELVSGDENCFADITFQPGPKSYKGITLYEVKGNHTTVYRGSHRVDGKKIMIEVDNFSDVEPFEMMYGKQGDALELAYEWEGNTAACTYENDEE